MMRRRGWSLRARLTALLLATLIPLAGLGTYWVVWEARHELTHVERRTRDSAARIAARTADIIGGVQGMLAVLARLPAVQARDRGEAERLFRELLATSSRLENFAAFTMDGTLFAAATRGAPGVQIHVPDRAWFQAAVQSRQPVTSDFLVSRITGNPVAVLAHPILDGRGQVLGVVGAALRLSALSQEAAPTQPEAQSRWAVVDGQDLVLLHGDPGAANGKPLAPLTGMLRAEAVVPGTQWRAIVGIPESLVAARVRQELWEIGLPALLVLLLATGVGFWIARDTWRPLQHLAAAVRRIGAGESGVRIPVEAGGEVGEVGRAFAQTLEALAARDADLRRRQGELTTLIKSNQTITSSLDLETILQAVVREAADISRAAAVRLFLLDEDAQVLRCRVGVGIPPEVRETYEIPVGQSFSGQVAATGEPLAVADTRGDPRLWIPAHISEYGLVSYLGLPVKRGERTFGVLVFNTNFPHVYSQDEINFLSTFAQQAAVALENARLHDAIRRHAATLEARVRERTAELEEALGVKAQFLANMSHELRTPLNAVLGFSEVLLGRGPGDLTAKQERYLRQIQGGGQRLLALMNDLLEMAESQTGLADFRVDRLAVGDLVAEVLAPLAVAANARQVEVTTDLDPGLPSVVADRRKLGQVLHHLVTNAVRFTPTGGRVTVRTRRFGTPEGEEAEFTVADTGIGIRTENLERIFRGFEQVDASDSRQYGGAGLGLALVRRLAELHGGRVWAESEGEGRGARFIVRLPLLAAPPAQRILIVEDEAPVLEALGTALTAAGYLVDRAPTGAEALDRLAATPPSLLVLDIGLPDVDGWEVLRQVRRTEHTRDLPILVLTGLEHVHADQALALGADEFLAKPVSAQVLVETVGRLLVRPVREAAPEGHSAVSPEEKRELRSGRGTRP